LSPVDEVGAGFREESYCGDEGGIGGALEADSERGLTEYWAEEESGVGGGGIEAGGEFDEVLSDSCLLS